MLRPFLFLLAFMAARAESPRLTQFERTVKAVTESMDIVENVTGRDVILFFGQSQVEKSTTINALRGVLFE